MKRRNFIGGLLSTIGLGATLKASESSSMVYSPYIPIIKSEEEQFYEFFEKFNGFPINDDQKRMYKYKNTLRDVCMIRSRRVGATTYLMTLTAWEACQGKQVVFAHSTGELLNNVKREYIFKCDSLKITPTPVYWTVAGNSSDIRGRSFDVCLYDSSFDFKNDWWNNARPVSIWCNGYNFATEII